ncbi:hypothetical protein [Burkholderia stagnalis]|uniref:hypothetical protein n=1 Tax=Burkholderia stagnalis TaxID=1503054 RepID=UPI000F56DFB0|nr:hypothetical protein [Burkholderia stagnalis]
MDYEVIGMSDREVAQLMAETGCADRMERIKRLMWEAQQAMKAVGPDGPKRKAAGPVGER